MNDYYIKPCMQVVHLNPYMSNYEYYDLNN